MTKPSLSEKLQKMASEHGSRSETDRLRDVFIDIEKALQKGVSRKAILEALHQDGFTMSLKMFDKALYRIRQKNKLNDIPIPRKESVLATPTQPISHELINNSIESASDKTEHPFEHLSTRTSDRRREAFTYNSIPDRGKIYGTDQE